jgi:hypothetical protein
MVEGLAISDRLWPASLVRALKSSIVSLGLFSGGSSDLDFSNSFPISLIRPGFSSRGACGGSTCCGSGCGGSGCWPGDCWPGDCSPSVGGDAACGRAH